MRSTIGSNRGDIVLVDFVFVDGQGSKRRPALVVSSPAYHRSRQEVVVAAITSNVVRQLYGDHRIVDWQAAGLLFPSTVTGILRTIKRATISRRLGSLSSSDLAAYDQRLRASLAL
jgi:mRNA interferase MazF